MTILTEAMNAFEASKEVERKIRAFNLGNDLIICLMPVTENLTFSVMSRNSHIDSAMVEIVAGELIITRRSETISNKDALITVLKFLKGEELSAAEVLINDLIGLGYVEEIGEEFTGGLVARNEEKLRVVLNSSSESFKVVYSQDTWIFKDASYITRHADKYYSGINILQIAESLTSVRL